MGRKVFHTVVAKLLFLSQCALPGLRCIVSFLCMRVTKAMKPDNAKLRQIVGYLKGSMDDVLEFTAQATFQSRGIN